MAHGIINVSTRKPCPICGKPDWCGYMDREGYIFHICMRDVSKNDVIGKDGNYYFFIKDTKKGNSLYEDVNQRELRIENYRNSNQSAPAATVYKPSVVYENQVFPLSNEKLDKIYRDFLALLVLEENDSEYLINEGWNNDLIESYLIKSFPEDDFYRYHNSNSYFSNNKWRKQLGDELSNKYGDLTGVPGAYKKNGRWTFSGLGGIIFPMYDAQGNIFRLRVRLYRNYFEGNKSIHYKRYLELKEQGLPCYTAGKYHNFSSYKEDPIKREKGIIANIKEHGCEAGNNISFYDKYTLDWYCCYITEGEKKSMVGNYILKAPFKDIPGVNSYSKLLDYDEFGKRPIDYLKEKGTKLIVVAFDADKAINKKVLDAERKTVDILRKEGFRIAIANWDSSIGKGIDDLLVNGGKPTYEFV